MREQSWEQVQAEKAAAQKSKFIKIGTIAASLIFVVMLAFKMFLSVGASEIAVVQYPSGKLEVYNTPGIHMQWFGSVTTYKKSFQYWFDETNNDGKGILVRFNDGGHATINGSCRVDLPTDIPSMITLHTKFGSQEAIEKSLVRTTIEKSVYMTGPLMSSKESSSTKRTDLINYISDQAEYGVYKTRQVEKRVQEDGSDTAKVVTVVELLKDTSGNFFRQEKSPFATLHVTFSNLSIKNLDYDSAVEKQIRAQQELAMQVQTAMARAKTAEQQVFTTQKEGEAAAAKAKWEQETIKAKAVTEAEQQLAVQKLATEKAAQYKQEQILLGEGEAERKRLAMSANGNMEAKLQVYENVMKIAWQSIGSYTGNWVPLYQSGNTGNNNGAFNMMEILSTKMLRDLNLDLNTKK